MTAVLEINGARIAYDVTGDGPPVVLVHAGAVVTGGVGGYESPAELPPETWEPVEAMWKAKEWEALSEWETASWGDGPGRSRPTACRTSVAASTGGDIAVYARAIHRYMCGGISVYTPQSGRYAGLMSADISVTS